MADDIRNLKASLILDRYAVYHRHVYETIDWMGGVMQQMAFVEYELCCNKCRYMKAGERGARNELKAVLAWMVEDREEPYICFPGEDRFSEREARIRNPLFNSDYWQEFEGIGVMLNRIDVAFGNFEAWIENSPKLRMTKELGNGEVVRVCGWYGGQVGVGVGHLLNEVVDASRMDLVDEVRIIRRNLIPPPVEDGTSAVPVEEDGEETDDGEETNGSVQEEEAEEAEEEEENDENGSEEEEVEEEEETEEEELDEDAEAEREAFNSVLPRWHWS